MLRRSLRAVAAGTLLAGPVLVAPVAASASTSVAPSHVAIVVGGVGSACVDWFAGMTGFDVLDADNGGAFHVTYGRQPPYIGFVFTIGGVGSARPDNTHYWAYFHDTGGGWQYSSTGGASYHPQPGTVEGWSYVDGQTTAPSPPPRTYADLCGGQDPSPRPTPTPTPTARRSTTAASPAPAATAPARTREPLPTSSSATADTRTTTTVTDVHTARATKASSSAGSAAPSPNTTTAPTGGVTTAAVLPVAVQGRRGGSGSSALPTAGTALGLLAVVVIGSAAYRQARRNRNGRAP